MALALTSAFPVATIFTSAFELISTPTALIVNLPVLDVIVISDCASIAMVLSLELMMILFLPVLSMTSIVSRACLIVEPNDVAAARLNRPMLIQPV